MKRLLLIVSLFVLCSASSDKEQRVYVCTGGWAKCYHLDKNCEGLNQCGGTIKQVTLEEAKKMDRGKPCGYCAQKKAVVYMVYYV